MGKPGQICASIAGVVFGIGWWLFIDGAASANEDYTVTFVDALPVTGVTIGFILLICFDWSALDGDSDMYTENVCGCQCQNIQGVSRLCLLFTLLISFGSIIGSAILLIKKWATKDKDSGVRYGVEQLIACICIFLSALLWGGARYKIADNDGW